MASHCLLKASILVMPKMPLPISRSSLCISLNWILCPPPHFAILWSWLTGFFCLKCPCLPNLLKFPLKSAKVCAWAMVQLLEPCKKCRISVPTRPVESEFAILTISLSDSYAHSSLENTTLVHHYTCISFIALIPLIEDVPGIFLFVTSCD